MMKKMFLTIALAAMTCTAVTAQEKASAWPWDFPQDVPLKAETGQMVLSCYGHYFDAVEAGKSLENNVLIFYKTTMEKLGSGKSLIASWQKEVEVPNALIIPLDKKAKAKKGDIVLTWWQSGSGMQRAIVIDDDIPTEPTVCYLDLDWPDNPDSPKTAERRKGEQLKPGTFSVIKGGKWQSGEQVAYRSNGEWKAGSIIHTAGDKVLMSVFASNIEATTKDRIKLIPFKEKFKVGDKVSVIWVSKYKPGYTVVKVDEAYGRVYVKQDGKDRVECKSIVEVTKVLDN